MSKGLSMDTTPATARDAPQGGTRTTVVRSVRISQAHDELLARAAAERQLNISDYLRELLARELPRQAA